MKKLVKTIAIVVLMAISATGFAQTNDVGNESNDSNPVITGLKIIAIFPVPLGVEDFVTTAYATITWYDPYDSYTPATQTMEKVDDLTFKCDFGVDNNYITHVTYEVWGLYHNDTKRYSAAGTFDITPSGTNTLIITSWLIRLEKEPDDPD